MASRSRKYEVLIFIAIILTAFVFRFQGIMSTPPGLYPDEAINGNDALKALESGQFKVFYPDNNGREGLFMNLVALSFKIFGPEIWAIRLISAVFGLLTVIGFYLLVRLLFNWQMASIGSFYLAVSFWHVNFSRIGFRAILLPFFMVWGFYFLWRGLRNLKLWSFALSGAFFSLGLYTYLPFRFVPLVILLTLSAYWWRIKKDYNRHDYLHLRNEFLRDAAMLIVVGLVVALPIMFHFWQNPGDFFGRGTQVSVFDTPAPISEFLKSLGKTMASFNFIGDYNWRHNFAGTPHLYWIVGVFFLIGLSKSISKLVKKWKNHGHPSTLQVLLLSWFAIMLLPAALTWEGIPHALRSIGVLPVAIIFAAEGTWWLFETLKHWYREKDIHLKETISRKEYEASVIIGIVLIILLAAIGIAEYDKYFNKWAARPEVQDAFSADFAELGNKINQLRRSGVGAPTEASGLPIYVVVNASGMPAGEFLNPFDNSIRQIPMPAQTVMFVTKTYTAQKQREKNVFYILPGEESKITQRSAVILKLIND